MDKRRRRTKSMKRMRYVFLTKPVLISCYILQKIIEIPENLIQYQ